MKYKITKLYSGEVEIVYGENNVTLTNLIPSITLTSEEYKSIPEYKKYLLLNNFVAVEFVEDEVKDKNINKK